MASYFTFGDWDGTPHAIVSGVLDFTLCGLDVTELPHVGDRHWGGDVRPENLCPVCRAALA